MRRERLRDMDAEVPGAADERLLGVGGIVEPGEKRLGREIRGSADLFLEADHVASGLDLTARCHRRPPWPRRRQTLASCARAATPRQCGRLLPRGAIAAAGRRSG